MNLSRDLRISKDRYFTKFRSERLVDYLEYSINFKVKNIILELIAMFQLSFGKIDSYLKWESLLFVSICKF